MTPSFNLVDQPWIPCLRPDGKVIDLSLRDLFAQAHEMIDLAADSPMENAALYRILLAILHRNFGPANSREWKTLWNADMFPIEKLNSYLTEWYDRFDLFSTDYPFMQWTDERFKPKDEVVTLKYGTGFKPNEWFIHEVITLDTVISAASAARSLLSVLAFGFGGTSGLPSVSHTDALCTKGVIFVIQGNDLKQTLLLNLNRYQPDFYNIQSDRPMWEYDEPLQERSEPFGLLDHYTYPSRSIRLYLNPQQLDTGELKVYQYRLGLGLRADAVLDPMKHYYESKTSGLLPLSFDEDRQLWRNSISLFEINPDGKRPPRIFTWLSTLISTGVLERQMLLKCKALGIAKNQGRADFARQEQFPLPLSLLVSEKKMSALRDALDRVKRTRFVLSSALALTSMQVYLDKPENYNWQKKGITHSNATADLSKIQTTEAQIENWISYTGAERHFWSALDVPFLNFMEQLGAANEEDLIDISIGWQHQIRISAQDAFRQVLQYTNQTPRAFKAYAYGNNRLQGYINKHYPLKEKST